MRGDGRRDVFSVENQIFLGVSLRKGGRTVKFERKNLADLHPAEYNPRKKLTPNDPEYIQIRNSLTEFGYADPIVINADGTIIKGHQRCTVMMDLGYTKV